MYFWSYFCFSLYGGGMLGGSIYYAQLATICSPGYECSKQKTVSAEGKESLQFVAGSLLLTYTIFMTTVGAH